MLFVIEPIEKNPFESYFTLEATTAATSANEMSSQNALSITSQAVKDDISKDDDKSNFPIIPVVICGVVILVGGISAGLLLKSKK